MTDRLYCRSGTALCTGAGGRLVVLDFAASEYLLLNGPAALVWHGRQSDGARLDRAAISAHGCRTSLRLPRRDGVRGRWRPRRPQARRDTAPAPASIGRSPPTRVTNAAQPNPAKPARRPGRVRRDCRAAVGRSRRCGGPYGPPLPFGRSPAGLSDTFLSIPSTLRISSRASRRTSSRTGSGGPLTSASRSSRPVTSSPLEDGRQHHPSATGDTGRTPRCSRATPLTRSRARSVMRLTNVAHRRSPAWPSVGGSTRRALPQRRTRLAGVERHIG